MAVGRLLRTFESVHLETQKLDSNGEADYDKFHDTIINTLDESIGKIPITTGRNKRERKMRKS